MLLAGKRAREEESAGELSAENTDMAFVRALVGGTPASPPQALPIQTIVQEVTVWAQVPATRGDTAIQSHPLSLIMMLSRGPNAISVNSLVEAGYKRVISINDCGFAQQCFTQFRIIKNFYAPLYDNQQGQVSLNPPLTGAFQSARAVGANIKAKSDATSGTRMNIAGSFNAGYITDIRGCPGLEPTKVASFSHKKERHLNLSTMDGIRFIQGAAMDPDFKAPDAVQAIEEGTMLWENVANSVADDTPFFVTPVGSLTQSDPLTASTFAGIFLSPWAEVDLNTTATHITGAAKLQNVQLPAVCQYDEPSFRLTYNFDSYFSDGTTGRCVLPTLSDLRLIHLWSYAKYDDNGNREIVLITSPGGYDTVEVPIVNCTNVDSALVPSSDPPAPVTTEDLLSFGRFSASSTIIYPDVVDNNQTKAGVPTVPNLTTVGGTTIEFRAMRPGFSNTGTSANTFASTVLGGIGGNNVTRSRAFAPFGADIDQTRLMYFGTFVLPAVNGIQGTGNSLSQEGDLVTPEPLTVPNLTISRIDFCGCPGTSPDMYTAWTLDWRNLPSGQNVNIDGTIQVQANTTSSTAPLLKKYGEFSSIEPTSYDMWLLMAIYFNANSVPYFRHVYQEGDYVSDLDAVMKMTPSQLLSLINQLDDVQMRMWALNKASTVLSTWGFFNKLVHGLENFGKGVVRGIGKAVDIGEKVLPFMEPVAGLLADTRYGGKADAAVAAAKKYLPMAQKARDMSRQLLGPGATTPVDLQTGGNYGYDDDDDDEYETAGCYPRVSFRTAGSFVTEGIVTENDFRPGGRFCQCPLSESSEAQYKCDAMFSVLHPKIYELAGVNPSGQVPGAPQGWILDMDTFLRAIKRYQKVHGLPPMSLPLAPYYIYQNVVFIPGGFDWKAGTFNRSNFDARHAVDGAMLRLTAQLQALQAQLSNPNLKLKSRRKLASMYAKAANEKEYMEDGFKAIKLVDENGNVLENSFESAAANKESGNAFADGWHNVIRNEEKEEWQNEYITPVAFSSKKDRFLDAFANASMFGKSANPFTYNPLSASQLWLKNDGTNKVVRGGFGNWGLMGPGGLSNEVLQKYMENLMSLGAVHGAKNSKALREFALMKALADAKKQSSQSTQATTSSSGGTQTQEQEGEPTQPRDDEIEKGYPYPMNWNKMSKQQQIQYRENWFKKSGKKKQEWLKGYERAAAAAAEEE